MGGGDGVGEFVDGEVDAGPFVEELGGFLGHPDLEGCCFVDAVGGGVFADVLADFHGAEMWAAHGAEMRGLRRVRGQGFVVEVPGRGGVQGQVELVFPAEGEAGVGQGVVPGLGPGVGFGEVGGVRGDLVGDDPVFDVVAVGQAEVFFGGDVAEQRGAEPYRGVVGAAGALRTAVHASSTVSVPPPSRRCVH